MFNQEQIVSMEEYTLIRVRVKRMLMIVSFAINDCQFIGSQMQGQPTIECIKLQENLKNLLLSLHKRMREIEEKRLKRKKVRSPYLKKNISSTWKEYRDKTNEDIKQFKEEHSEIIQRLQDNYREHLEIIISDIQACFDSTQDPLDEELICIIQEGLLQESLKELKLGPTILPSCFISYSWGNLSNTKQVHRLARNLKLIGINVKLDIWDNTTGSIPAFISQIETVDNVIVIGTLDLVAKWRNYITKGESRQQTGEDYRGNVVTQELALIETRKTQKSPHGILCLLLEGDHSISFPGVLQELPSADFDFRDRNNRLTPLFNLLKELVRGKENKDYLEEEQQKLSSEYNKLDNLSREKLLEKCRCYQEGVSLVSNSEHSPSTSSAPIDTDHKSREKSSQEKEVTPNRNRKMKQKAESCSSLADKLNAVRELNRLRIRNKEEGSSSNPKALLDQTSPKKESYIPKISRTPSKALIGFCHFAVNMAKNTSWLSAQKETLVRENTPYKINVGTSDFKKIIESGCHYVDKTEFIKHLIDHSGVEVKLFIRPRRFGKTLNMSMVKYFFEKADTDTSYLFGDPRRNLKIWQSKNQKYRRHQGQYPVISLTFKSVSCNEFETSLAKFAVLISDLYKKYKSKVYETCLKGNEDEQKFYQDIIDRKADQPIFESAIKKLTEYLNNAYDKRVIILIDEYDTPIHASYNYNYYEQMIHFMRGLLGEALKDTGYVQWAVLTGILRVSKESLVSGFNNPVVYSLLNDGLYNHTFGFTDAEVRKLLCDCLPECSANDEHLSEIEDWYGGYRAGAGSTHLYNPWSIMNLINKSSAHKLLYDSYWTGGTESGMIIGILDKLRKNRIDIFKSFMKSLQLILTRQYVEREVDEHVVFSQINEDEKGIWNFLVLSGYLSAEKAEEINSLNIYRMLVPNYEVVHFFEENYSTWLDPFSLKFAKYKEYLAKDDGESKSQALKWLKEKSWIDEQTESLLLDCLSHTDRKVREKALKRLVLFNKEDSVKVIEKHIAHLGHVDDGVRQTAIESLIISQRLHSLDVQKALALNLSHSDFKVRASIVALLRDNKMLEQEDILDTLITNTTHADKGVRETALNTLIEIKRLYKSFLLTLLYNEDNLIKETALGSLLEFINRGEIINYEEEFKSVLQKNLYNASHEVREKSSIALYALMNTEIEILIQLHLEHLKNDNPGVREDSVMAIQHLVLSNLYSESILQKIIRALLELIDDVEVSVRRVVVGAIEKIKKIPETSNSNVIHCLTRKLEDDDLYVGRYAANALNELVFILGHDEESKSSLLKQHIRHLSHLQSAVRQNAIDALSQLKSKLEMYGELEGARDRLCFLLQDTEIQVRNNALAALKQLDQDRSGAVVRACLWNMQSENEGVIQTSLELFKEIWTSISISEIVGAFNIALKHNGSRVVINILGTLQKIITEKLKGPTDEFNDLIFSIAQKLNHPDILVRNAALNLLVTLDKETEVLVIEEYKKNLNHFNEIVILEAIAFFEKNDVADGIIIQNLANNLKHKTESIRESSFNALVGLGKERDETVIKTCLEMLTESNPLLIKKGILLLSKLKVSSQEIIEAMVKTFSDSHADVRQQASLYIEKLGILQNEIIIRGYLNNFYNPNSEIVKEALIFIEKLGSNIKLVSSKLQQEVLEELNGMDKNRDLELKGRAQAILKKFYSDKYKGILPGSEIRYKDINIINTFFTSTDSNDQASLLKILKTGVFKEEEVASLLYRKFDELPVSRPMILNAAVNLLRQNRQMLDIVVRSLDESVGLELNYEAVFALKDFLGQKFNSQIEISWLNEIVMSTVPKFILLAEITAVNLSNIVEYPVQALDEILCCQSIKENRSYRLLNAIIQLLYQELKSDFDEIRGKAQGAITTLENFIPQLIIQNHISNLQNDDVMMRQRATKMLGMIGDSSEKVVNALVVRLLDEALQVRIIAVRALERLGQIDKQDEKAFIKLDDHDLSTRTEALITLSRLSKVDKIIIMALSRCIVDVNVSVRQSAIKSIRQLAKAVPGGWADFISLSQKEKYIIDITPIIKQGFNSPTDMDMLIKDNPGGDNNIAPDSLTVGRWIEAEKQLMSVQRIEPHFPRDTQEVEGHRERELAELKIAIKEQNLLQSLNASLSPVSKSSIFNNFSPAQQSVLIKIGQWYHANCHKLRWHAIVNEHLTPEEKLVLEEAHCWTIHGAVEQGRYALLEHLLKEHKLDPNNRNVSGQTPLHLAAASGHKDKDKFCALLIQYKADPTLKNQDGSRPFKARRMDSSAKEFLDFSDLAKCPIILAIPKATLFENKGKVKALLQEYQVSNVYIFDYIKAYVPSKATARVHLTGTLNSSLFGADNFVEVSQQLTEILSVKTLIHPRTNEISLEHAISLSELFNWGEKQSLARDKVKYIITKHHLNELPLTKVELEKLTQLQRQGLAMLGEIYWNIVPDIGHYSDEQDCIYHGLAAEKKQVIDYVKKWNPHVAASDGEVEIMTILLEQGLDPNNTDPYYKTTLLNKAYFNHCYDMCILLLKHGAQPEQMYDYEASSKTNIGGRVDDEQKIMASEESQRNKVEDNRAKSGIETITNPQKTHTANKAHQHFIGIENEEAQRLYEVWYSERSILYLLHSTAKTVATAFLPYMFINQATPGCSFSEQFRELMLLRSAIGQDICFIATEPSSLHVPHFVYGVLTGDILLLINPVGLSKHHDFNETLVEFHKRYQLTVYLSVNVLQQESGGLVSCGPICVELALGILAQTKEEWANSLRRLVKSGKGKEQESAWLHRVDISPLLPPTLQDLSQLSETAYQERLIQIRAAHGDRLIAISSTLPREVSENTFWDQCENAEIQIVMNQLCLEKKTIIEVQDTSAFQRLAGMSASRLTNKVESTYMFPPTPLSGAVPAGISCQYTYAPSISRTDIVIEIEQGATLPLEWDHLLREKLMASSFSLSHLTEQEAVLFKSLISSAPSPNINRPIAVNTLLENCSVKVKFLEPKFQVSDDKKNITSEIPSTSNSTSQERSIHSGVSMEEPQQRTSEISKQTTGQVASSSQQSTSSQVYEQLPMNTLIKKLLKKAKAYKNSPDLKPHILLEWYGFILGLSKKVEEETLKQIIHKKIASPIKHFVLGDTRALNDIELKNLAANFNGYRTQLENIRLEAEEFKDSQYRGFLSQVEQQFRELVDDMLDYDHLPTQEFYHCLSIKLLKQAVADCKQLEADLKNLMLRKKHLEEEQKPIYELKKILEHPLHLARLLALFLEASGEDISLQANFFDTIESLKGNYLKDNYTTWLELVERLLPKRLELQIESRSAEARVTLAQLHTLYPLNELCIALNSIVRRVETILNNRSELKLSHSAADVLKKASSLKNMQVSTSGSLVPDKDNLESIKGSLGASTPGVSAPTPLIGASPNSIAEDIILDLNKLLEKSDIQDEVLKQELSKIINEVNRRIPRLNHLLRHENFEVFRKNKEALLKYIKQQKVTLGKGNYETTDKNGLTYFFEEKEKVLYHHSPPLATESEEERKSHVILEKALFDEQESVESNSALIQSLQSLKPPYLTRSVYIMYAWPVE